MFAIIADPDDAPLLARCVGAAGGTCTEIAHWAPARTGTAADSPLADQAHASRTAKEIVDTTQADTLIVKLADTEQVALLTAGLQRGLRIVLVPQLLDSPQIYRLIPSDEEHPGQLIPAFWHRGAAACRLLRHEIASARLGRVLHVQMERTIQTSGLISPLEVQQLLLEDVALVNWLIAAQTPLPSEVAEPGPPGASMTDAIVNRRQPVAASPSAEIPDRPQLRPAGEYQRVTAILSGGNGTNRVAYVTVNLAGTGTPDAAWICRGGSAVELSLSITLERGQLQLVASGDPQNWRLHTGSQTVEASSLETAAGRFLAEVDAGTPPARWTDLVRAIDIVDCARRSIQRRRTIEVPTSATSELAQFKEQMAALGCGVIVYTLLAFLASLLVATVGDPRDSAQRQSEAAGFVIPVISTDAASAAAGTGSTLTATDLASLARIAPLLAYNQAELLVATRTDLPTQVERRRRDEVLERLRELKSPVESTRVALRPLRGGWFRVLLAGCWVLSFLPLGAYLFAQLCILVIRPRPVAK